MLPLYLCYFTFGFCMSFGGIAMNFEMIDNLKFTPVELTVSVGIISIPWCIKPLFGMISDKYPIMDWGKRRPYISFCGMTMAYMYIVMSKLIVTKASMVATMTIISFLMCFTDVCADCITVDYAKRELVKGKTQGSCWTARALGGVIGSTFGGSMYTAYGTKAVFQLMAIPSLAMGVSIWSLPPNTSSSVDNMWQKIFKSLYKKRMLAFSLFILGIGPNYGPFYTYFLRKELNFKPEDFQWITMASSWSFLLATFSFKTVLLKVEPLKMIRICIVCGVVCEFVQVLVVSKTSTSIWLIVIDSVGESLFGMLMLMPLIVVVAHHAKDGIEGTFYALLMAVSNLSSVLADELGGLIGSILGVTKENFDNLKYLVIICAFMDLFFEMWIVNNKSFCAYFHDLPQDHMHEENILEIPEVCTDDTQETLELRPRRLVLQDSLAHTDHTSVIEDCMLETSGYTEETLGYIPET